MVMHTAGAMPRRYAWNRYAYLILSCAAYATTLNFLLGAHRANDMRVFHEIVKI